MVNRIYNKLECSSSSRGVELNKFQNIPTTAKLMFVNARKILPVVTLNSENLIDGTGTFFIDSGLEISLIKKSVLRYSEYVNTGLQVKI